MLLFSSSSLQNFHERPKCFVIHNYCCRWIKSGKAHNFVFIGKEIVATASGIYVSFLNLNTRERRIERFDNKERGDGASCLAGHPVDKQSFKYSLTRNTKCKNIRNLYTITF